MLMTQAEYDAVTRQDFTTFVERVFGELNPQTPYLDNFHVHVIAEALDRVRRGELKRLIINVPPRSLKSIAASVALPAWIHGHDPEKEIIAVSYGQELSDSLARGCRQVMQQPWYERVFPRTRLSPTRQAVHTFETTAGGVRIATSVGGVLTGMGADVIIIDDPVKPEEALSEVERQKANDWYRHSLVTRLNDKQTGAIVVVMQRLHEDDLVGHIVELDDWEILSFAAIAEHDEVYQVQTPFGSYTHRRRAGEALHPEREPLHVLAGLRRSLGSAHFAAQYLQTPAPPGGGTVKVEWFRRYDKSPKRFDRIIQSWDTASKVKERNDYSVCTIWGVKDKAYYLLGVVRERYEYPQLKAAVLAQAALYPNPHILIEDKGNGTPLIQDLKRDGILVTACEPHGEKVFRMEGQTAFIEAGGVYIPREAHWLEAFLHEVSLFPRSKFDDQVDSMSQALNWARNDKYGGWFDYIRQETMRARGQWQDQPNIRFRHDDPGMGFQTITGRCPPREPDGSFLVTPEEWQYMAGIRGIHLIDDGSDDDDD